jgi:membrane protein YdbS with pleckstrin-like domain
MIAAAMAERERLDPRFIPLQRVVGQIFTAGLSLAAFIGILVTTPFQSAPILVGVLLGLAWLVGTIGLSVFSYWWPPREYATTSYVVDADGIEIQNGVYWRAVTTVPRTRVQHTDVAQGPLERRYGLATLVIYTAGTEHAKVELPGLAFDNAMRIRDLLLPKGTPDAV